MFKVFVTGRLCRDAKASYGASTAMYYKNVIAVDRVKKLEPGEDRAIFIDIVAWNYTAKYLSDLANKGTMVAIFGDYDIDGRDSKDDKNTKPIIKVERAEIMIKGKSELEYKGELGGVDWMMSGTKDDPIVEQEKVENKQALEDLKSMLDDKDDSTEDINEDDYSDLPF